MKNDPSSDPATINSPFLQQQNCDQYYQCVNIPAEKVCLFNIGGCIAMTTESSIIVGSK
jgi:hypothetical protein